MSTPKKKTPGLKLSWFFTAMILLSVLQGVFSIYNLQKTIRLQESARIEEEQTWRARQTLADVHYSVYKLLGTMDPYKMDTYKSEYEGHIEKLIDDCSHIEISVRKSLELKEVYDSIVDLQYQFAVNMAKELMNNQARKQYNELTLLIEKRSAQISDQTDSQLTTAVSSSIVSIVLLQIFVITAIIVMGRFYARSLQDKRKADLEIKQAHQSLTSVLDSATQVAIIAFDSSGLITLFNKGAVEMLDIMESETLQQKNIISFIDPEELLKLSTELGSILGYTVSGIDAVTKRITTEHPYQGYLTVIDSHGDRITVDVNITVSADDKAGNTYLMVAKNVMARLAAEEALRKQQESLRTTLNSIGDAVIATDAEGVITRMNPVAEQITGWDFSEAKGRSLLDVFNIVHSKTRKPHPDPISAVLNSKSIINLESNTLLISKDGREVAVADSGAPIIGERNEIDGVVLVFRDITEEQKTEEKLRQSQKMDAIGQLAGGVAHDFNNMLNAILNAAELLAMSVEGEELQKLIGLIINASDKASGLTKQLLTFSRKDTVEKRPVNLHTILLESVQLLERSVDKKISIKTDFSAQNQVVMGDSSQLQNIFINLGINARDAMPEGGELLFKTSDIELDWFFCESSTFDIEPGTYLSIEVKDSGKGIDPETQKKIFEPFFTTKEVGKGTGLGLAAVYGAVQEHRGAINVYSEMKEGTVFHIYLPLLQESIYSLEEKRTEVTAGTGTILLVDDEEVLRASAEIALKHLGFTVLLAVDGEEAVEQFRKHKAEIDIVILDMIMPQKNGEECFKEMVAIDPTVKVLFCSGFTRDISVIELQGEGPHLFIQKPYSLTDLSEKIMTLMQS